MSSPTRTCNYRLPLAVWPSLSPSESFDQEVQQCFHSRCSRRSRPHGVVAVLMLQGIREYNLTLSDSDKLSLTLACNVIPHSWRPPLAPGHTAAEPPCDNMATVGAAGVRIVSFIVIFIVSCIMS